MVGWFLYWVGWEAFDGWESVRMDGGGELWSWLLGWVATRVLLSDTCMVVEGKYGSV